MRRFSQVAVGLGAFGGVALTALVAAPAVAVDFVSEAVNGLKTSNITVDSSASISHVGEIAVKYQGSPVGIVAVPSMATETFDAQALASQILGKTGGQYKTIIVVVDGPRDSFGVASVQDANAIATELNSSFSGDAGQVLWERSSTIIAASSRTEQQTTTTTQQPEPQGIPFNPVTGGAGILIGLVLLFFLARNLRHLWPSGREEAETRKVRLAKVPLPQDADGESLRQSMEKLERLRQEHSAVGSARVAGHLGTLLVNTSNFFTRLSRKGTPSQVRLASVRYADTFKKLATALDGDHYLDILQHPSYWENPKALLGEAESGLAAVGTMVLDNIRQLNGSQDLEFRVALESLNNIITKNEQSVEHIMRDNSAKEGRA